MVPTIGIMIGFYIITRMASFLTRTGDRREQAIVQIFAVVTIIVTALAIVSLFGGASSNAATP
jgi:hypothetical protein